MTTSTENQRHNLSDQSFYVELWLINLIFFIVALFGVLSFATVLAGSYIGFSAAKTPFPGLILAIIILAIFGLPTFVLAKGTVQLFLNRWRYFKKYSQHSGDSKTQGPVTLKVIYIPRWGYSLTSVTLNQASENSTELKRLVMAKSPNAWFKGFEDGAKVQATIYWRNNEPYLVSFDNLRIWLWPPDDRDKPDSFIGRALQKFDYWLK